MFLAWYGVSALRWAGSSSALIIEQAASISLGAALAGTAAFTFLNPHVYIDTVMLMGAVGRACHRRSAPLHDRGDSREFRPGSRRSGLALASRSALRASGGMARLTWLSGRSCSRLSACSVVCLRLTA